MVDRRVLPDRQPRQAPGQDLVDDLQGQALDHAGLLHCREKEPRGEKPTTNNTPPPAHNCRILHYSTLFCTVH
eukprot:12520731-Alexandrium_andersonii.AAC.1